MAKIRNIITSRSDIRKAIHENVVEGLKSKFPVSGDRYTADISDVRVDMAQLAPSDERKILASKGNRNVGVYCTLTVKDNASGKTVASLPNHRIMSIPWYTNRYTMLVDGNEYAVVSQMRTKSGVYTRKRGNDELESSFNLAKGANFKLVMDPATGVFSMDILNSKLLLLAVLKILGAAPSDAASVMGDELYGKNHALLTDSRVDKARDVLYGKLVRYKYDSNADRSTSQEKDEAIRAYFAGTKLDPETTGITLGSPQTSVTVTSLLQAIRKMLAVSNGDEDVDERDDLEFQKIYCVEDLLREVLEKNTSMTAKYKAGLNAFSPDSPEALKKLKAAFGSGVASAPITSFLTTSSISRLPSQINPMEFVDTSSIITRLGEGAIGSERAVPFSTRNVTYSSAGLIDPIAAPESFKIGLDVHATMTAAKGDDHEFYKRLRDCRTGELVYRKAIDVYGKKVGFPDPGYLKDPKPTDDVPAVLKGKLVHCMRGELDYQIPNHGDLVTYTTATIPFMNANQGNRLLMGDKHVQQAMPLENPDKRLVKSANPYLRHGSTVDIIARDSQAKSPVDGVVVSVDDDYVYVQCDDPNAEVTDEYPVVSSGKGRKVIKVDYDSSLPLANKTFLEEKVVVKPGDRVKANQCLTESNYTKDGEFAAGRNVRVAYMPYKGLNHEDGVVISEAAAKKFTSVHADKIFLKINRNTVLDKDRYRSAFPTNFTLEQLRNIGPDGLIAKGSKVKEGDPLILAMESNLDSKINLVLGKFHKSLMHPYRDCAEVYDMHYEAEVTDSLVTSTLATVILRVKKPVQIGDKLSGSYGNKGVCAAIIPTEEMPVAEDGKPVEAILTPAGLPSRINPGQLLESALGKVAVKTGRPYAIENFSKENFVDFVLDEMKKNGVKEKENLVDPATGKVMKNVFTGVQHMYKLFKTTDTNFAARGIEGGYDQDDVPAGSGEFGPKGEGGMEVNALMASNVRSLLREGTMLRSSKNSEFWKAFQTGGIPNYPTEKKTFTRFTAILKQAGINVTRRGNQLVAAPLTDEDIEKLSNGEVHDPRRLEAKTLKPEPGGLFDEGVFGGIKGDRWGHIDLAEPIVNPVMRDAARSLLGMNGREFDEYCVNTDGAKIKERLNSIDVDKELERSENALRNKEVGPSALDGAVKRVKYLRALRELGKRPGDAYVLTKLPVLPPVMRPVTVGMSGDLMEADANKLYRDLMKQNNAFRMVIGAGLDAEDRAEARKELLQRAGELAGTLSQEGSGGPKGRTSKGALEFIAGDVPKTGYFYKKVIYSRMNMSGRSTISPDTTLGLDEIGLPVDTAWTMYKPFIIRRLSQMGYDLTSAKDAVEERTDVAKGILEDEMRKRPVLANRAPTLWRHGMLAAKPLLREGKNIRVNALWEDALNADYDGDAMNIHLPITDEAVEDAKKLFPSKQIFHDKKSFSLLQAPKTECIMGLYKATANAGKAMPPGAKVHRYANVEAAWKDYYAGRLEMTDYVEIGAV